MDIERIKQAIRLITNDHCSRLDELGEGESAVLYYRIHLPNSIDLDLELSGTVDVMANQLRQWIEDNKSILPKEWVDEAGGYIP